MKRANHASTHTGVTDVIVDVPTTTRGNGPLVRVIEGKYELIREIGRGAMGVVYEARHRGTGRAVAVKLLVGESLGNAERVARFRREALASGAIESQHVAQVLDTGVDPETESPYIVMELLAGEDLRQVIRRIGAVPPDLALRIVAQALLGLRRAHEAGVVHRDIKPANLFIARRDDDRLIKILDFGIAKMPIAASSASFADGLTRSGSLMGSPSYISPEQARGKKTLDHRTDIWSVGIVLYELLAGATPHQDAANLGDLLVMICSEPAPPVTQRAPWVSPEIAAIVRRALALDPDQRYRSAKEMYDAVRPLLPNGHALDDSLVAPRPESTEQEERPPSGEPWSSATTTRTLTPAVHPSTPAIVSGVNRVSQVDFSQAGSGDVVGPAYRPSQTPLGPDHAHSARDQIGIVLLAAMLLSLAIVVAWAMLRHVHSNEPETVVTTPAPVAAPTVDEREAATLADARLRCLVGDCDAAHDAITTQIREGSPLRSSDDFREIEARWADLTFARADTTTDAMERRSLLRLVEAATTVDAVRRLQASNALAAMEHARPSSPSVPKPAANQAETAKPSTTIPPPVRVPTSKSVADQARAILLSDPAGAKALLVPRVVSGQATADEVGLLRTICKELRDAACLEMIAHSAR